GGAPRRPRRAARRGDRAPPHAGPGDRTVDGADVPPVRAPPPRRMAHRGPRRPLRLRQDPPARGRARAQGARAARRALPPLAERGRVLLLAGPGDGAPMSRRTVPLTDEL